MLLTLSPQPEVTELQGKLRQAEGQLTSARRGIDAEKKKVAEQIGEVKKLKKTVADFKETQKALELDLSRTKKELAERTNEVAKRSTVSPAKTDTKALDSLKRSNAGLKGEVSTASEYHIDSPCVRSVHSSRSVRSLN